MPGLIGGIADLVRMIRDPDQEKRNQAIALIQQDPNRLTQLAALTGGDPSQLESIIGRNARFGIDTNTSSNIVKTVQQQPIAIAKNLQALNDTGVNTSGYADLANRAMIGMTPEQKFDAGVAAYKGIREGTSNKPDYLSQEQKDLLTKSKGLETSYEANTRDLENNLRKASALSQAANARESEARATELTTSNNSKLAQAQRDSVNTGIVDNFFANRPDLRAKPINKLFDKEYENDVPGPVLSAILASPKYGQQAQDQIKTELEKNRLAIEQERNNIEKKRETEWYPRLVKSSAIESMIKYGGDEQGYTDLFQGKNTPAAQQAREYLAGASPKDKDILRNEYITKMQALIKENDSPNAKPDDIETGVQGLNILGARMNAMGINTPPLKYDISTKRTGPEAFWQSLPGTHKTRTIQTITSNTPQAPVYKPDDDPFEAQLRGLTQAIDTGQSSLDTTLNDSRTSPVMRKRLLEYYKNKGKK